VGRTSSCCLAGTLVVWRHSLHLQMVACLDLFPPRLISSEPRAGS
jgi:hypothetical protein